MSVTTQNEYRLYHALEQRYWWFQSRRDFIAQFLALVPNQREKTLLEVGCGTGGNIEFLFNKFKRTIGLEVDENALAFAKSRIGEPNVIHGDANQLDKYFQPGSIDTIAFLDVLYHQKIDSVDQVLAQAHRLLSDNGHIIISDGAFSFLAGRHSSTVGSARRFTKQGMLDHLENAGFEVLKSSYWGLLLFMPMLIKRRFLELFFDSGEGSLEFDDRLPATNGLLTALMQFDRFLLRFLPIPFGTSIVVVARKRHDDERF